MLGPRKDPGFLAKYVFAIFVLFLFPKGVGRVSSAFLAEVLMQLRAFFSVFQPVRTFSP